MKPVRQYMAAVVQMDSQNDKGANLKVACRYIDEAAARGARLVCFPEVMNLNGKNMGEGGGRELIPGYTTQILMDKAREHGLYIHSGSLFERIPGDARAYNTSVLIDPAGQIVARYRKLHTFDATLADGTACRESDRIHPGTGIVTVDTALGRMGLSICYDIRFPELYRAMALQGAEVVFTPANFTYPTGKAHWEPLLRARAIENFCYILAPDQTGQKEQYLAYGNSMIIDPWGQILARADRKPCILYAQIDLDRIQAVRAQIPSLRNRRTDIYDVTWANSPRSENKASKTDRKPE